MGEGWKELLTNRVGVVVSSRVQGVWSIFKSLVEEFASSRIRYHQTK